MSGIVGRIERKKGRIGRSKDTIKAWAFYNQVTPAVLDSLGLSSITDTAAGRFQCIFSSPTSSSYYAAVGMSDGGFDTVFGHDAGRSPTQCEIRVFHTSNEAYEDNAWTSVMFFGD